MISCAARRNCWVYPQAVTSATATRCKVAGCKELRRAREIAIQDMPAMAAELGATAVLGVDIDYETISSSGTSMLMFTASGTAVKR
jgi:uncharacterized protein YbjQ (UPF0145 family)